MTNRYKSVLASLALGISSSVVASSGAHKFTFYDLEFQPRDERLNLAQAYVAQTMAPGTSMATAIKSAKDAGARCSNQKNGDVVCTANSMQRKPGEDISDIQWRIRLVPSPDGTMVSHAFVRRTKTGM